MRSRQPCEHGRVRSEMKNVHSFQVENFPQKLRRGRSGVKKSVCRAESYFFNRHGAKAEISHGFADGASFAE
jgi:hypothetical protein